MTFSIDPPRRVGPIRRSRKAATAKRAEASARAEVPNLPVPVDEPVTLHDHEPITGGAAIEAQLLGQKGARRGLRAGAALIKAAKASYEKTNWSGSKDRRMAKGRIAKTDV